MLINTSDLISIISNLKDEVGVLKNKVALFESAVDQGIDLQEFTEVLARNLDLENKNKELKTELNRVIIKNTATEERLNFYQEQYAEKVKLETEIRKLKVTLGKKEELIASRISYQETIKALEKKLENSALVLKSRTDEINSIQANEFAIRSEIVGLTAKDLQKVVFVFDRSSSMNASDGRWESALSEVRKWLTHLPIKEIALIDFNISIEAYPADNNSFLNLRDKNGDVIKSNMTNILNRFSEKNLKGGTNTYEAITTAYKYDSPSLIILFTDGKPNVTEGRQSRGTKISRQIMEDIENFVYVQNRMGNKTKIFTVALGNYSEVQIRFLKKLALLTNGGFIGK